MNASQAITTPAPGADEMPPADVGADGTDEEEPQRRRRLLLLLLLLGLLALLIGLATWYLMFRQPIPIPTLPGEIVMPTYSTSVYGAERPMGVAVSPDGSRVYVGETQGDKIARVFDASGTELGLMQPPVSTGREHVPVYLATDPLTGEVYVTDRPTGSIYIYDANGTYQRAFNPGDAFKGWQPLGIGFDTAGTLYVTDVAASPQRVLAFDRQGALVREFGKDEGLNFPNGVAVDASGIVYVSDSSNGRLLAFDQQGNVVARVGRGSGEGNLGLPRGVAVDGSGRVYVGDATGQGVFVFGTAVPGEKSLTFLGSFGSMGVSDGEFQFPNGVAVDGRGRVYVTDSGNDRVQVWSY